MKLTLVRCSHLLFVPAVACSLFSPARRAHAASSYPATVLADNPSAHYRLEETSGVAAADSSVNGVAAAYTYNSANTYPQLGLPGITTHSSLFNGGRFSTDVGSVDIPPSALITPAAGDGRPPTGVSSEPWVRPAGRPAT